MIVQSGSKKALDISLAHIHPILFDRTNVARLIVNSSRQHSTEIMTTILQYFHKELTQNPITNDEMKKTYSDVPITSLKVLQYFLKLYPDSFKYDDHNQLIQHLFNNFSPGLPSTEVMRFILSKNPIYILKDVISEPREELFMLTRSNMNYIKDLILQLPEYSLERQIELTNKIQLLDSFGVTYPKPIDIEAFSSEERRYYNHVLVDIEKRKKAALTNYSQVFSAEFTILLPTVLVQIVWQYFCDELEILSGRALPAVSALSSSSGGGLLPNSIFSSSSSSTASSTVSSSKSNTTNLYTRK